MTLRTPVVIGAAGLLQQLQPGDYIAVAANTPSIRSVTNGEASAGLTLGAPVYATAADTVKRGQANTFASAKLCGLCYDATIAAGAAGNIAASGVLIGTTGQWDAVVTGETGGLSFGTMYCLDPANPGKLTATPPTTVGQVITWVGTAISTTELELSLALPLQL